MDPNAFRSKKLLSTALIKPAANSVSNSDSAPAKRANATSKPTADALPELKNQLPLLNGLKSQINLQSAPSKNLENKFNVI